MKKKYKNEMQTIEREIFRSGYSIDGRFFSRPMVKKILQNTKKELLEKGILIPLKLGHDDKDQRLKGRVLSVKLKKKLKRSLRTFEYCIFATIQMSKDAYTMYRNDELPNLSVEINPLGFDENGKEFGEHIFALALLGTDSPAFPWLMQTYEDKQFCFSILPKEYKNMDIDKILKLLEEIDMRTAEVRVAIAPEDGGEEDEAKEDETEEASVPEDTKEDSVQDTPSDDKNIELSEQETRIKELEQTVKDLQAEKSFADLHAAGKIASDQKKAFSNLVKETTIKFAIDHYSGNTTKSPPKDRQIKSTNKPETLKVKELTEYWKNYFSKTYRLTGENLEKHTKKSVEIALKKESKNGSNR